MPNEFPIEEAFKLSQNYPTTYDKNEVFPWQNIDFSTKETYKDYMDAVLKYCFDGNVESDFKVQNNTKRKWYHAPWMHDDGFMNSSKTMYIGNGREPMRGLTKEFTSQPNTLHDNQDNPAQTWAIAFYNEPGGYTFGQVWNTVDMDNYKSPFPNILGSDFPEGSVCFKLIFTSAPVKEVPHLDGSLAWDAYIYDSTDKKQITKRVVSTVRLVQVDIAVKDKRALNSEWVLGTFTHDASSSGKTRVDRLVPVGIGWDNDSEIQDSINKFPNNFKNEKLKESIINPYILKKADSSNPKKAYVTHLGIGGRMNGPVDNMRSSCISCHSRAAVSEENLALGDILDFSPKP